jgi:methyl-accepting chemotaxis protein
MRQWTVGQKLLVGVGLLVVFILVMGGAAEWGVSRVGDEADHLVEKSARTVELATLAQFEMAKTRAAQRHAVLATATKDDELMKRRLDEMLASFAETSATATEIVTITDNDQVKRAIDRMREALAQYDTVMKEIAQACRTHDFESANAGITRIQASGAAVEAAASDAVKFGREAMNENRQEMRDARRSTNLALMTLLALGLLVSGAIAYVVFGVTRTVTKMASAIREGNDQILDAANQVASSAESLSQGATQQAAALEESSASIEEMRAMTRQNAESAKRCAGLMDETSHRVDATHEALHEMTESMSAISQSSHEISRILRTIDEIAFQTNILALNAAVEAARAGDAGMGFAVVADEVRALAARSAQAARDTATLIDQATSRSKEGEGRLQQMATAIDAITSQATMVKTLVQDMSVASVQQAEGIDQVASAIIQMEKITQSTAATAEESAAASEQLNAQAEQARATAVTLAALVTRSTGKAAAGFVSMTNGSGMTGLDLSSPANGAAGAMAGVRAKTARVLGLKRKELTPFDESGSQGPLHDGGGHEHHDSQDTHDSRDDTSRTAGFGAF